MSISRKITSAAAGLSAAAALAVLPASALAEGPVFGFHDAYTVQVSGYECGIWVEGERTGVTNISFYEGQGVKIRSSIKTTLTNPDTGKSVVISFAGLGDGPAPIIDEEAGTATFESRMSGLSQRLQASDGSVRMVSAGTIGFVQVLDFATGEITTSPNVEHGPHPGADEAQYCAAMSDALL